MEMIIDEIASRIRNFYYYGATREGMSCSGDNCKCIVNITDEQALAYLREKKDNTYLVRCCKWKDIRKFADFYNDGLLKMVSSKWHKNFFKISATGESTSSNACDAIRNGHRGQTTATGESSHSNTCDAVWNRH